ncbi:YARHG domain-containing protein [Acinetobacter silvestris]|uniref:Sporulation protein n=1 Tax=Acinetobacter silvestris TaxID=1977882 RepID=A0A1Y3CNJ3_9GAMM|nr:YARHG domain-containing protein [Acinetobacter silvestris]OTG66711.1 sporulation protein [Acinetobacter silvestris]
MKNTYKVSLFTCLALAFTQHSLANDLKQFQKSWTGEYDERKITVFIQTLDYKQLTGYSILGANKQNFSGQVRGTPNSKAYKAIAVESGPKASSGTFTLVMDVNQPNKIEASWESSLGNVKPKFFELKPQQCRYQLTEGAFPEASQRLLKDVDLQISPEDLDLMRNTIYARHGYSFANKQVASYFATENWYMPCNTNVEAQLTAIEKTNIQRIKKVRPYMEKMQWGR